MKKYILIAVSAILLVSISVVGTLAFLTDKESVTNVFTVGKVDIKIIEDFKESEAKLVPGNNINKDVQIENVGDNAAYVWYTYAIPAALDNADASLNILHINHAGRNWLGYQNETKYWEDGQTTATPENKCWMVDKYVTYNVDVNNDGVLYNVYSVLYNGVLAVGETTTVGLTNVYFDTNVDYVDGSYAIVENGVVTPINYDFSNPDAVKLIITAYAIQADGFENVVDAYAAYAGQWGLTVPTNP